MMSKHTLALSALSLLVALAVGLLAGCGGSASPSPPAPSNPAALSASDLNLIFVVGEDLAYNADGDMNPKTANLTSQGLQRSLLMGTFLQQNVLSGNVSQIYALEPMTHLQTASNNPDMVGLETVQQFAVLNQITLYYQSFSYPGNGYPINASYGAVALPSGVPPRSPLCAICQGIDFNDEAGDNEALIASVVKANNPGFYVFSAPWETTSALLTKVNALEGYNLALPTSYRSPNYIYAIAITPSGNASLVTYNSNLNPSSAYPVLPAGKIVSTACTAQEPFRISVPSGQGSVVPAGINTNETVYFIRHAEAHPKSYWSDNNYVGAGQWRALDLPNALRGKMNPQVVVSVDPAQFGQGTGTMSSPAGSYFSSVAPSLTAEPYAIANNLPYKLAASVLLSDQNVAQETSDFLFTRGTFSNQTVLVAWVYQGIAPTVNALLASYNGNNPPAPDWPDNDYDSIWTVSLDANGKLTVSKSICEGINSEALPATPPVF